jgi:hypothetical protein
VVAVGAEGAHPEDQVHLGEGEGLEVHGGEYRRVVRRERGSWLAQARSFAVAQWAERLRMIALAVV